MKTYEWWYIKKLGDLAKYGRDIVEIMQSKDKTLYEKSVAAKTIESDQADAVVKEVVRTLRTPQKPIYHSSNSQILNAAHDADGPADEAEKAAHRMAIYGVELDETSSELLTFLDMALQSVITVTDALGKQRRKKTDYEIAAEHCEKIKQIESEADLVYRNGLKKIAAGQNQILDDSGNISREDLKALINASRRKEILEILEHSLDKCQSLADKLESLSHDLQ